MKKIVIFILYSAMILSLVACENNNKEQINNPNPTVDNSKTNTDAGHADSETDKNGKDLLSYPYQVPGKAIVVDVPNYHPINRGYTQLFNVYGIKYIAITVDLDVVVASLTEAHTVAFEKFKKNIQTTSYVETLTIHNEEVRAVNGVEVYRYEGVVGCAKGRTDREWSYDAYVIGYSFIMDGVPCTITGSVVDKTQPQEMIEEMETIIDAMIETLRSEK